MSVAKYLNGLQWDGVPRIDTAFIDILHALDTPEMRTASRQWFIDLVSRALDPGCKVGPCLVLHGPPGCGKTLFLATLAGDGYLSINYRPSVAPTLEGAWIVELESCKADDTKAFLTATHDVYRPAYRGEATKNPRTFVLVITIDGSNPPDTSRRFDVVSVGGPIDITRLRAERGQLLAEAVTYTRRFPASLLKGA